VRRPRGGHRGQRLNLIETLKHAAPRQRLRGNPGNTGQRLQIRVDDFRVTRYRQPTRTTTVFVVDASGSAALHRLAEAKGAVELLLAECYVRRDRVAMISFRGLGASLELPPTRSLVRAKRRLAGLPGGGGTPLAAGLDLAADIVRQLKQAGETPVLVVMTDGKANIARTGEASRPAAMEDAMHAARLLATLEVRTLFIDTAPRPRTQAAELASMMRARYLPLPPGGSASLPGLLAAS
jgi:magnesium chelatase subunit D